MNSIQIIFTPILLVFGLFGAGNTAAQCGFSEAHVVKAAAQQAAPPLQPIRSKMVWNSAPLAYPPQSPAGKTSMLLPRWTADALPFFCRVEHDWVKEHGRVPLKFRLGSVEYVDWLEGKSFDQTKF